MLYTVEKLFLKRVSGGKHGTAENQNHYLRDMRGGQFGHGRAASVFRHAFATYFAVKEEEHV